MPFFIHLPTTGDNRRHCRHDFCKTAPVLGLVVVVVAVAVVAVVVVVVAVAVVLSTLLLLLGEKEEWGGRARTPLRDLRFLNLQKRQDD